MSAGLAALAASGHLRRVDLALGEWIERAFPAAPPEAAMAAVLAARAIADGHSALALDQAQAWLAGLGQGKAPPLPGAGAWREALRRSPDAVAQAPGRSSMQSPLVLDPQDRIYLRRYFAYEQQLAEALVARTHSHAPRSPAPGPRSAVGSLDPEQQRAIDTALAHRFALVTGGPGTGKTHVVVRMLVALAQDAHACGTSIRIALAAPTGKASARLAEALRTQLERADVPVPIARQIPRDATTVHRLLGMSPWRTRPAYDRTKPLPFDVVVVDEVSMVDLPLMARLVDAVPPSARLVLLGDPGQLAAVEAGNVLGALVAAAHGGPLHDCHVALVHSHRFSADSALGALSSAIARGDADAALRTLEAGGDASLVAATGGATLIDTAANAYRPILDAHDPSAALAAARDFRVLTALRHGPAGCIALDHAIAQRLQRAAGVSADERWWKGRLILVAANRPELGLFNGDTGVVWPDADGTPKAWFEGAKDAPRAFAPAALPPHEGAFALTVHKAQGSEFGRVALVTGSDSPVLSRELLYTGVTRARTTATLYTTRDILRIGISRPTVRFTGLADRLREAAQRAGT